MKSTRENTKILLKTETSPSYIEKLYNHISISMGESALELRKIELKSRILCFCYPKPNVLQERKLVQDGIGSKVQRRTRTIRRDTRRRIKTYLAGKTSV